MSELMTRLVELSAEALSENVHRVTVVSWKTTRRTRTTRATRRRRLTEEKLDERDAAEADRRLSDPNETREDYFAVRKELGLE